MTTMKYGIPDRATSVAVYAVGEPAWHDPGPAESQVALQLAAERLAAAQGELTSLRAELARWRREHKSAFDRATKMESALSLVAELLRHRFKDGDQKRSITIALGVADATLNEDGLALDLLLDQIDRLGAGR